MNLKSGFILVAVFLSLTLLLLSCTEKATSTEPVKGSEQLPPPSPTGEGEQIQAAEEALANETAAVTAPSGPCQASWVCLSSNAKIYRYENCSFGKREDCKLGCVNDECKKPSTCPAGFKCNGQHYTGYQLEDCSWINQVKCEWGCENAECLPEPNETTTAGPASSSSAAAETAPAPTVQALKAGETGTFQVNEEQHTIKIYNMEESRARLEVDGQRSDWVNEGDSVTFASGVKIKLFTVLYRGSGSSLPSEIEYVVE